MSGETPEDPSDSGRALGFALDRVFGLTSGGAWVGNSGGGVGWVCDWGAAGCSGVPGDCGVALDFRFRLGLGLS